MKPASSRAATARVLADIDAAVRPVERARTAAAVDRVLASAAPGPSLLVGMVLWGTDDPIPRETATPGMVWDDFDHGVPSDQRERYAPWNVSPHLFPSDPR